MSDSGERGRRQGRPTGGRPGDGKPSRGRPEGGRPQAGRPSTGARPDRGAPRRPSRPAPEFVDPDPLRLRSVRTRHDDPIIPEDVQAKELDRVARAQLKTLEKENADEIARHLVMVARLIDSDPELAHQHALSAARRGGRISVVRETLAITAYSTGDFALALRELRTYRRISGKDDQLPLMVDSERGLGRPDRALELGRSVPRASLPVEVQVLLAVAMSGARLDLGQPDAALVELQIPQLDPQRAFPWSPDLFDAYATVLEELGRNEEAEVWFRRAEVAEDALESRDSDPEDDVVEIVEEDGPAGEPSDGAQREPAEDERSGELDD